MLSPSLDRRRSSSRSLSLHLVHSREQSGFDERRLHLLGLQNGNETVMNGKMSVTCLNPSVKEKEHHEKRKDGFHGRRVGHPGSNGLL